MTFSPVPAYLLGSLSLAIGLNSFIRPCGECERFGLPLEPTPSTTSPQIKPSKIGAPPALIYLKGIREITYGLALIALQYYGQETAVTIVAAIFSLAGLGDGFMVWNYGGSTLKRKAFGHWMAWVVFAGWSWWRAVSMA